jgi:hypothetical protein
VIRIATTAASFDDAPARTAWRPGESYSGVILRLVEIEAGAMKEAAVRLTAALQVREETPKKDMLH